MTLAGFQQRAEQAALACAAALGVSLPFSVALDGILVGLILACWLGSDRYRDRLRQLRRNPVALTVLAFVAVVALGLLWGDRAPGDGMRYLGKYSDLALAAVLITLFRDAAWRRRALLALAWGIGALVVASYLSYLGLVPPIGRFGAATADPLLAKGRITHGILMVLGAFLFALLALEPGNPRRQSTIWLALAALAVGNALLLVSGRTAYVVLAVLIVYLGYARWRLAGFAVAVLAFVTIAGVGFAVSPVLRGRVDATVKEVQESRPGVASEVTTGSRLEFYRNTLAIIRERPLAGVGTGGFPLAYERKIAGTSMIATVNPHNEYLLLTAQLGVIGLAALLALFWVPWRLAPRLPTPLETHFARALVLTIAIGCLFNSLLIDHVERLLFVLGIGVAFGGLPPSPAPGDRR